MIELEMLTKMRRLAKFAHNKAGQKYGNSPYDYHLQQVEIEVSEILGYNHPYLVIHQIVANGHDLFEDTDVDAEYLRHQGFSEIVIEAIEAITKRNNESRKDYIERVKLNPIARAVKIADSLSNLTHSVRDGSIGRIKKYTSNLVMLHQNLL